MADVILLECCQRENIRPMREEKIPINIYIDIFRNCQFFPFRISKTYVDKSIFFNNYGNLTIFIFQAFLAELFQYKS